LPTLTATADNNVNLSAFTPGKTKGVKSEIPEAGEYRAHRK
jgi:hypothetical protein